MSVEYIRIYLVYLFFQCYEHAYWILNFFWRHLDYPYW